ncbi:hypothetical protein [Xanthovirga aplysinae]|uniref:hypothetical protein n=1 Tax=Xanthovirga aplysinae TaxID=2529853 RepID=UPI0012BC624C|nr:hypothetical protein [Xanthovirga aplysinae]
MIFSLAVASFIIGVHQSMTIGIQESYWLFMISTALFFWYKLRKGRLEESSQDVAAKSQKRKKN